MEPPMFGDAETASPSGSADLVKDTTAQTFMADVIEASKEVPILVDFWAPWCEPCKQLGPLLEKIVKAANGAVRMVKMDIDAHPEIAGQLQVQSIPAVFAFKDGQPVDAFLGVVPESQIKTFIEKLAGPDAFADAAAELDLAEAALEADDLQTAVELYAGILAKDQQNIEALAGLAKCYIKSGDFDQARETLDLVPPKHANNPAVSGAQALLELSEQAGGAGDVDALRSAVTADKGNYQARFDLALALNIGGAREEALEALLELMRLNREWNEDGARKQLLVFFDAWGDTDPATIEGRRKMSVLLFS